MNSVVDALVPVLVVFVIFGSIVSALRLIVDARVRRQMVEQHVSEDMVRSMVEAEERHRRFAALKWGLVLTLVGFALVLVRVLRLDGDDPATYGLMFAAAGVGMLAYHFIADRRKP